jgi:hypothetical protein
MRVCNQCGSTVFIDNMPCPRCAEGLEALKFSTAKPRPPMLSRTVKWVLAILAVLVIAAVLTVRSILHSLGSMNAFG